jgi:prephenate dehydrogenase
MTSSEPARIAVIGTGLIGTSIALAASRAGDRAVGFDTEAQVLREAATRSGLAPADSLAECLSDARYAFVCTPIGAIGSAVTECLALAPDVVVTDAGSVKRKVLAEVETAVPLSDRSRFVGGHPMTGSERGGPEAASASLVEGATWVFTPAAWTDPDAVDALEAYVVRLGGHPLRMEAEQHDRLVALVSHVPQVVSSSLMALLAGDDVDDPRALSLAASGFRDVTRLAGSDPGLWTGILEANREAVLEGLDRFADRLSAMRALIADGDESGLHAVLTEARNARATLGAKPRVRAGMALLQIPVPDRPGVLAHLAAALGDGGVNIEDLQIVHSPWGPAGVVHLTVLSDAADAALGVLETGGFDAVRVA